MIGLRERNFVLSDTSDHSGIRASRLSLDLTAKKSAAASPPPGGLAIYLLGARRAGTILRFPGAARNGFGAFHELRPHSLFMRLAPNPHVCCLLLLSTKSPASTLSTPYIEIPRGNGQHGQHAKPPSIPTADSHAPEHLSLLHEQILSKHD